MSESSAACHLFWQWQKREHTFTLEELQVVRAWAWEFFPASIELIDFDIWKLQPRLESSRPRRSRKTQKEDAAEKEKKMAEKKLQGYVKTVKKTEGYGFVTHAVTGEDYFFHRSAVEQTSEVRFEDLEQDQAVEFIPILGPKGARAIQVRAI